MGKKGFIITILMAIIAAAASTLNGAETQKRPKAPELAMGTATLSEECGACHIAIYREYAMGFGGDLTYKGIVYKSREDKILTLPTETSVGTLHSLAGIDPFPVHARGVEKGGQSCDVCHFPIAFQIPDLENIEIGKPQPRPVEKEKGGVTCASLDSHVSFLN
ncbi:MAG TPA: hypothetical protein VEF34_04730 [Syntrophobacteraceae bacterium]|nr:hypothetical protein [Syntrophobacteraceae bacterium]